MNASCLVKGCEGMPAFAGLNGVACPVHWDLVKGSPMEIIDNTVDFKTNPIKGDELLLGCGHSRVKQLSLKTKEWSDLVTLDMNREVNPDVVWDLIDLPLPFEDETFKELHIYDVLEHLGQQGDYRLFFRQFEEFHRILKPGGFLFATCPSWDEVWAWGDPGHTRMINEGSITFLDQDSYDETGDTPRTDYRFCYQGNFEIEHADHRNGKFCFVLRKK